MKETLINERLEANQRRRLSGGGKRAYFEAAHHPTSMKTTQHARHAGNLALALLIAALAAPSLNAQSSSAGKTDSDDDVVEFSAFSVTGSRDRGYAMPAPPPSQTYATGGSTAKPNVPVTLIKRPDAIVMELTLTNADTKQDVRNRDIYATIAALRAAVQKTPGMRLEERELQLRGNAPRRTLFFAKTGNATSVSTVLLVADFTDNTSLFETVRAMRATASSVTPVGATKVTDNTVGFLLKNPDQYRREILAKIFEDLEFVKKGLGSMFEVLPRGFDGAVQMRPCSEKEVELWIDYSFSIRSVLELQNPVPKTGR